MRRAGLIAAAVASVVGTRIVHAVDYTWDGTGSNSNWSNSENWTADSGAPSAPADRAIFDNVGIARTSNTLDSTLTLIQLLYRQDDGSITYTTSIDRSVSLTLTGLTGSNAANTTNSSLLVMPTTAAGTDLRTGTRVIIQSTGVGTAGGLSITSGNVQISGRPGPAVNADSYAILDLRNLDSFSYSQATNSAFSVGGGNMAGNADNNAYWGQLFLSDNSTIRANRVIVGGQNNSGSQGIQPVSTMVLGQTVNINTNLAGNFYQGCDPAPAKTASGGLIFRAGLSNPTLNFGDTTSFRNGWEIGRHRFQTGHFNFGVADFTSASGTAEGTINAGVATLTISAQSPGTASAGGGFGMLSMNRGTIDANSIVIARTTSAATGGSINQGVLNVGLKGAAGDTGEGTVQVAGTISLGQRLDASSGGSLNAILNIDNDGAVVADRVFVGNNTQSTGTQTVTGIVNLNSGTLTTSQVRAGSDSLQAGTTTRLVNLDGGTLRVKAGAAQAHRDEFLQGHTAVNVYSGGGTFDTNGQDIVINQDLVAPAGSGVASIDIAPSGGGAGYRVAPIVVLSGGGGTGATAVARINSAGEVIGFNVTSAGTGYTSAPTVELFANAGTSATNMLTPYAGVAAAATAALAPNTSGGITKIGDGTLTLTGNSTYTGPTTVSGGTLLVNGSLDAASAVIVNSGATFGGSGSVGSVTINSGGNLSPGASVESLNVASLSLAEGSTSHFEIAGLNAGEFDTVLASGAVAFSGTLAVAFDQNYGEASWGLFNFASSTGNFTSIVDVSGHYAPGLLSFDSATGVLVAAVPEPAFLGLLVTGSLALLRRRRVS